MRILKVEISRPKIKHAEKVYAKWAATPDEKIPDCILDEVQNLTTVIDSYESQLKKNDNIVDLWSKRDMVIYASCNYLALKFKKALIKIWDKEYPEHLDEILSALINMLKGKFDYDLLDWIETFEKPCYKKPGKLSEIVHPIEFDFTK